MMLLKFVGNGLAIVGLCKEVSRGFYDLCGYLVVPRDDSFELGKLCRRTTITGTGGGLELCISGGNSSISRGFRFPFYILYVLPRCPARGSTFRYLVEHIEH
jgi:hypothetical protein